MSNSGQQLYFVNVMKNRLDTKAKRGAVVKALAFGSRRPFVPECFKAIAHALLDKVFEAGELSE